jgi:Xaa-Pro aminopeptidase
MQQRLEERRQRLAATVRDRGLDAYLVLFPGNRFYLSGFELHDPQMNESAGCLVIGADEECWLCTDPRYAETARSLWPEDRIHVYTGGRNKALATFLSKTGVHVLGFEPAAVSYELYAALRDRMHLVPEGGLVEEQRAIKDEDEIERLRRSCSLNHDVLDGVRDVLRPGVREDQVAWAVEKGFRERGASELAFPTIVAFGPNAARPHHEPGKTELAEKTPVLVDTGCRLEQYCSDQSRTFWGSGSPPDYFRRTLELVQEAQKRAIQAVRPGLACRELYRIVREYFAENGVQDRFTHALGHGIGLDTHEAPSLGPRSEGELRAGMVVTIEPGLYYPEWGGVRWEHMIVVRENGAEVL